MKTMMIRQIGLLEQTVKTLEQIAVLYIDHVQDGKIYFLRSWKNVCAPAMAGFDENGRGENTIESWKWLDENIEIPGTFGIRGIFHSHPAGIHDFSDQDVNAQEGLAKTYGKKWLWHGVQSYDSNKAHFICAKMIGGGQIIMYDYGFVESKLTDSIIVLPAPPSIVKNGNIHTLFSDDA